jgi:hypothetical protein
MNNSASSVSPKVARIRALNDHFRRTLTGGRYMITDGVRCLGSDRLARILQAVRTYDRFDEANDPHGEHDFGSFDLAGDRLFWKIDYYDRDVTYGSPDPSDAAATTRVLTIMLADEY